MFKYEALWPLFQFMKVKILPKKHWSDAYGWEMGEYIDAQVLKALKVIVMGTQCLLIIYNEMMFNDNQQWLLVHVYVVENWMHIPLLLLMTQVIGGSNVDGSNGVSVL